MILSGVKFDNQLFIQISVNLCTFRQAFNSTRKFLQVPINPVRNIAFLSNISKALIADGSDIPDLRQHEIDGEVIVFPLGGSTLTLWTSRLQPLNRPEFHLYDRAFGG